MKQTFYEIMDEPIPWHQYVIWFVVSLVFCGVADQLQGIERHWAANILGSLGGMGIAMTIRYAIVRHWR